MTEKKEETHESYGMIGWNRIPGTAGPLFGSPLEQHPGVISIEIHEAFVQRDLGRDWFHARTPIASIQLSALQFAEFITSPGQGDGIPCTIVYWMGERKASPPLPTGGFSASVNDFRGKLDDANRRVKELREKLDTILTQKDFKASDRRELKNLAYMLCMEVEQNLGFYQKTFMESAVNIVGVAKAQIVDYWNAALHRLGIRALTEGVSEGSAPRALLPELTKDDKL